MRNVDQVIEEIRQGRRTISDACHNDPAELVAFLKGLDRKYADQIARFETLRAKSNRKEETAVSV